MSCMSLGMLGCSLERTWCPHDGLMQAEVRQSQHRGVCIRP